VLGPARPCAKIATSGGTRFTPTIESAGNGPRQRRAGSSCPLRLPAGKERFPAPAGDGGDTMSGLFASADHVNTIAQAERLQGCCWKSWSANPVARVAEVAYRFEPRAAGDS